MTLSITGIIPNSPKTPTCKQFLQVHVHCGSMHGAGQVSVEVARTLAVSEYEKYNIACLEWEASQMGILTKQFENLPKNWIKNQV